MNSKIMDSKKNKKGKRKVKGKKFSVSLTKSGYENLKIDYNRELGAEWSKAAEIENNKIRLEENLEKLEEDIKDVKDYLAYAKQEEERETSESKDHVNWLKKRISEQKTHYEAIIADMEQEYNELIENQKKTITETETTITILQSFERRRLSYVKLENEISESEERQTEMFKKEIYEAEKNILLAEAPQRREMEQKLENLFTPLSNILTDDGKKQLSIKTGKNNYEISAKIAKLGDKYLKLLKKFEYVSNKEKDQRLELEIDGKILKQIENKNTKIKTEKEEMEVGRMEEELPNSIAAETTMVPTSKNSMSENIYEDVDEIELLFQQIEDIVLAAIDVENSIAKISTSLIEEDFDDDFDTDSDRMFKIQIDLINQIEILLDQLLQRLFEKPTEIEEDKAPITPVGRIKEEMKVVYPKLMRDGLYRHWQWPRSLLVAKLKKEAKFPLPDVSLCFGK